MADKKTFFEKLKPEHNFGILRSLILLVTVLGAVGIYVHGSLVAQDEMHKAMKTELEIEKRQEAEYEASVIATKERLNMRYEHDLDILNEKLNELEELRLHVVQLGNQVKELRE